MTTAEQNVFVGSGLAMLSRTHVETEGEGRGERGRGRERREGVWEVVAPLSKPKLAWSFEESKYSSPNIKLLSEREWEK